jgi:hypothetical protein
MSAALVEQIANAVLYEGYILYPYRSSSVKNRQRWNFGVVYPRSYSEAQGEVEPHTMETQCLALGGPSTSLSVKVRCLRLVDRVVGRTVDGVFVPAASIEIRGRIYDSWQEAAECEMCLPAPACQRFVHPATRTEEALPDGGLIVRTQRSLECVIEASVEQPNEGLFRIGIRISNDTPVSTADREAVLAQSLLSTHAILQIRDGEFVSLLDPPPQFQEAAAACRNIGAWPVLAGEEGTHDTMLSSPIILYDYPQVAPESPGDLFDGAEIDEILSLRILTLTDEEKAEMRRSDDRARRILERTETLPPEHFMKLHGTLRGLYPAGKEAS